MIRKIELINFMSHRHTVLELAEGLTALIGPNNCGKSAVVAALKIVATNDSSTYVKRHAAKECRILLELEDDNGETHHIEWGRKSSPYYVIDGRRFDRLKNAGIPDRLHELLKMPTIHGEGGAEFDLHFGEQKSPVFLLNSPPTQVGQFFASSSDASYLLAMQRLHSRRVQEAKSETAKIDQRLTQLESHLEQLAPAVAITTQLENAAEVFEEITKYRKLVTDLRACRDQKKRLNDVVNKLARQQQYLAQLAGPPDMTETAVLAELSRKIPLCMKQVERLRERQKSMLGLAEPPELESTQALDSITQSIRRAELRVQLAVQMASGLGTLCEPPVVTDVGELISIVAKLQRLSDTIQHRSRSIEALRVAACVEPPSLDSLDDLRATIAKLKLAEQRTAEVIEAAAFVDQELQALSVAWQAFIKTSPNCPTCMQPLPETITLSHAGGAPYKREPHFDERAAAGREAKRSSSSS